MLLHRPIQLAVVGLGAFGQRYLRALRTMSDVEIAWVSDLDADRCRAAGARSDARRLPPGRRYRE